MEVVDPGIGFAVCKPQHSHQIWGNPRMQRIGVVAIGRNEGQRLMRCLESVTPRFATVYVDSGSTDDSVNMARARGVEVVELDMSVPFTAARARNAGLDRLRQLWPDFQYVQFLDGDCELADGWLDRAVTELDRQPRAAAVFGRLSERHPDASIYNRLCDLEWDSPIGVVNACGGNAAMRIDAVDALGGFNPEVIAAEDDEICLRLRRAGWIIVRVAGDMATHDAAMTRAVQWWKRAVRCGFAYAQGAHLYGRDPEHHFSRERRRAALWGMALPLASISLAWPTSGMSLAFLLLYPLQLLHTYRGLARRVPHRGHAFAYALHCILAKFPQAVGVMKFHLRQLRRIPPQIIEYKEAV